MTSTPAAESTPAEASTIDATEAGIEQVPGGVCAVPGVCAAGVTAGLKPSGQPDLALVDAGRTVAAAVVQTRNQVKAAPVIVTAEHLADGRARAVLLNAGSANACTGAPGVALARESAAAVGDLLGCAPADVALCSTGVIGQPVPRAALLGGIRKAVAALSADGAAAARAILTTDTVAKEAAVRVTDARGSCVVGGMAKGAGMLAPELATMLCVVTTDAPVAGVPLREVLRDVVARTFGRISVDGCMSTNDAVVALATGAARPAPSPRAVRAGLLAVCARLAEQLVRDGEGAHTLVRVRVTGAKDEHAAVGAARAVAGSALFRAAVGGGDPNWGRVLAALGAGPVPIDPDRVTVGFGDVTVCRDGVAAPHDRFRAARALAGDDVVVAIDLGGGQAQAELLTCDLSREYVTINAEYTT